MEEKKDMLALLDMMIQPVFCVKDNVITRVNAAARQLFLEAGDSILPLLEENAGAYAEFSGGWLYLPLNLSGQTVGATVRRVEGTDIFEIDSSADTTALRAMALAAAALRKPLSSAMAGTASLQDTLENPDTARQLSQLNQNLHQLLRMVGNMSDAEDFSSHFHPETINVSALFREIFEKAGVLAAHSGLLLSYEDLPESVYCLADRTQLERAVLNILSNAMKFTPRGGRITASLVRRGNTLRLSVQDSGSGVEQTVISSLFQRYLRQPGIEDSRFGIGLGLSLVHAAALHHGGTLLLTETADGGTRTLLTIAIRQKRECTMHSPIFTFDYTGGFDHSLVELSDSLPAQLFDGNY